MAYKMGNCQPVLKNWQKGGYTETKKEGEGNSKEKLLNGHFWQLNGTDRGNECRKMCFF